MLVSLTQSITNLQDFFCSIDFLSSIVHVIVEFLKFLILQPRFTKAVAGAKAAAPAARQGVQAGVQAARRLDDVEEFDLYDLDLEEDESEQVDEEMFLF